MVAYLNARFTSDTRDAHVSVEAPPLSSDNVNPSIVGCVERDSTASSLNKANRSTAEDLIKASKLVTAEFLNHLPRQHTRAPPNQKLRRDVADEIAAWNAALSWDHIQGPTETSCAITESAYAHTSYEHQQLIAIYTACVIFADDLGQRNFEAIAQFAQRLVRGELQLHPALSCMVKLFGTVHKYFPRISADAIITSAMDFFTSVIIELTSKSNVIAPLATRYPYYLRLKTALAPAYAHFCFVKSWGESAGVYHLQLLPELELVICGINDILSFYKETLAGEADNYVHMRATAERKSPVEVLRELVSENLEVLNRIHQLSPAQPGLHDICSGFIEGYVEFHLNARRYRLHDLDVTL